MHSFDYDAVVYDGAVYCTDCLPDGVSVDSEEVSPIFADSEWDYYPACDVCHEVHAYMGLTAHGQAELARQAREYSESDPFTIAYIETALWSSMDESDENTGGRPMDENYSPDDLSDDAIKSIVEDCRAFQEAHAEDIASDPSRAGHDFWLTRNHHGAGFWDGDWPEDVGRRLTDAAHAYGSSDLYVGDDGKVEVN